MSQNTRCPACQTLFKVVPDQLRVSEGWVRCGRCSEIFDAHSHLYKEPFAPQPMAYGSAARQHPIDASDGRVAEPAKLRRQRESGLDSDADTGRVGLTAPQAFGDAAPAAIPDLQKSPSLAPLAAAESAENAPDGPASQPAPLVTFLQGAKRNSFWHATWVRSGLALAALCLLIALALQVTFHQRDRIAATLPAARPGLAALCQALDCRVLPLRQIESVVIDGSTFTELRGNVYRLGFTIKNTAQIDLAMPALELTLTDAQDRAALRRVFLPAEFGATSTVLSAGAEWAGTLAVGVRANGGSERIAGYRILTLYP